MALVALCVCSQVLADNTKAMHEIDIALAHGHSLPLANKISFIIPTDNVEGMLNALAKWPEISATVVGENKLKVVMSQQPKYRGEPDFAHTQSSFVIDYEEDAVQAFINDFETGDRDASFLNRIEGYVADYITEPTYVHGFNIASLTAQNKSGDCTEYSVLVAALARAKGLPARVVLGSVITEFDGVVGAYGHAWTEVWLEDEWHIVDAALHGSSAPKTYYFPQGAITREDPGFGFAMVSQALLMPRRIEALRNLE